MHSMRMDASIECVRFDEMMKTNVSQTENTATRDVADVFREFHLVFLHSRLASAFIDFIIEVTEEIEKTGETHERSLRAATFQNRRYCRWQHERYTTIP